MLKMTAKKGSFFVPLVIFMAIVTLFGLVAVLYFKSENLQETLGDRQIKLLTVYQTGEKYLNFVDESVKLSIKPALLEISRNGLKKSPDCWKDSSQKYVLWANDITDAECNIVPKTCYPAEDKEKEKSYFVENFKQIYDTYIDDYNNFRKTGILDEIPKEYNTLNVEENPTGLELVGIAKNPIVISKYNWETTGTGALKPLFEYKVKPSFRQGVGTDFIKDGALMSKQAGQLLELGQKNEKNIQDKLAGYNALASNQELQWKLDSYSIPQATCSHNIGTCTYACNCVTVKSPCPGDSTKTCPTESCETCVGADVETVTYNDYNAAFSVASGKGFYVSDPPSAQPQLKSLDYKFGLSWLEETGRSTSCVP